MADILHFPNIDNRTPKEVCYDAMPRSQPEILLGICPMADRMLEALDEAGYIIVRKDE